MKRSESAKLCELGDQLRNPNPHHLVKASNLRIPHWPCQIKTHQEVTNPLNLVILNLRINRIRIKAKSLSAVMRNQQVLCQSLMPISLTPVESSPMSNMIAARRTTFVFSAVQLVISLTNAINEKPPNQQEVMRLLPNPCWIQKNSQQL